MLGPVHFLSRASGTRLGQIAHGCLFTGWESQRRRLTDWLDDLRDDELSLFVVTGSPGAGTSALLGGEVCLAHPQLRDVAGIVRTRIGVRQSPLLNSLMAAVHARQRTDQQVFDSFARQLSLHLPKSPPGSWTVRSVETRCSSAGHRGCVRGSSGCGRAGAAGRRGWGPACSASCRLFLRAMGQAARARSPASGGGVRRGRSDAQRQRRGCPGPGPRSRPVR